MPEKKSYHWINVFAIVFIINFFVILLSMNMLKITFDARSIFSILLISIIPSIFLLLGYLGMRLFSFIVILADLFSLLFVLYIAITQRSSGMADLAAIVGFLYIVGIGIIAALIIQIIYQLIIYRRFKQDNK